MQRILIADDNPNFLLSLKAYLESSSVAVDTAGDGSSALSMVRGRFYDLLITDLHMGDMTGLHLSGLVRRLSPQTRILLVTGEPLSDSLKHPEPLLDGAMSKASCPDRLKATVRALLREPQARADASTPSSELAVSGKQDLSLPLVP